MTGQRLDKWLWVTRFFKTRSLAAQAIGGGKIRVNGQIAKAAREVKTGDLITIQLEQTLWQVEVKGFHPQRRPASEASLLYEETADSKAKREAVALQRAHAPTLGSNLHGRPTKRDRRLIEGFKRRGTE